MHKKRNDKVKCSFIFRSYPHRYSHYSFHNLHNKGQVTIFIILGIVLLLIVALIIILKEEVAIFKPEEISPTEKGKVENFIALCISQLGDEAIFRLGQQGGYVAVPGDIANDEGRHLRISPFAVIPYWAYGETKSAPSLQEVKEGIDNYINEHLRDCLFALQPFQESYSFSEKSEITANTEIAKSRILFNVHWVLEIKNKAGDVVAELADHAAESSVKLKQIHELAEKIIDAELRDLKFEDIAQDLIALEHPKVPVAGLEFSCGEKKWPVKEVKTTLQNLLRVNIREIKVKGTSVIEFPEELPYYQSHYLWDIGEELGEEPDLADVTVQFSYENNLPFSFEVSPRSGAFLQSNQLGGSDNILSLFCLQTWKFVYDLGFPVIVALRDETTGYVFKMAFTVHLQKNFPNRKEAYEPRKSFFADTFSDEDYCREKNIPVLVSSYELIENEQTGVFDVSPLEDVELTFACLRYSCGMGKTEFGFAGMGNVAAYRTNFPYCAGGIVRGEKEGYKDDWERIVTESGKEVRLELTPLFSVPLRQVKVVKHDLIDSQQIAGSPQISQPRELAKDEVALIKLTYRKSSDPIKAPFHEENIVYSKILDMNVAERETVTFLAKADFTYQLEINILDNEKFVGGYIGNWTVPWEELQMAREIIFHTFSKESADEQQQFSMLANLAQNSRLVPLPEIR